MKFHYLIILLTLSVSLHAGELTKYMTEYAQSHKSNSNLEKSILANTKQQKIISELSSYYTDTNHYVRQKAYYLTYKKGIHHKTKTATPVIHQLLKGCSNNSPGITGQNIGYLKQLKKADFDEKAKAEINHLLDNRKTPHYKELVLLAGYVETGKEILQQRYTAENTPEKTKYYINLALARMGSPEHINKNLKMLKAQPINNNTIGYAIPMAIYTRQKKQIAYCIKILNIDKKLCSSPNPDYSGKILCGYRVVELLAPAIKDFPIELDAMGSIKDMPYEKALETARKWFKKNPEYQIIKDTF